jgi:hypothetical protein
MRLIQRKMLPKSRQIHLAEVFLSGLLEQISPYDPAADSETVRYDFISGAGSLLIKEALVSETLEVIDLISAYIEENMGIFRDFSAVIPVDGLKTGIKIRKGSPAFAAIKVRLLKRLGGVYAKLAERMYAAPIHFPRRREPIEVSEAEFKKVFRLNEDRKPLEYVQNDYVDNGDGTVTDRATGLMWEKSGSKDYINYEKAKKYIEELNRKQFAGYSDWRLPTVDEMTSLLEPEKQSNGDYINPIFDSKQWWCWSADTVKGWMAAWLVYFLNGDVNWNNLFSNNYVRGVRS